MSTSSESHVTELGMSPVNRLPKKIWLTGFLLTEYDKMTAKYGILQITVHGFICIVDDTDFTLIGDAASFSSM